MQGQEIKNHLKKWHATRCFYFVLRKIGYFILAPGFFLALCPEWICVSALAQQGSGPLPPGLIREGREAPITSTAGSENESAASAPARLRSFDDWVHRCAEVQIGQERATQCELLQVRQVKQEETMMNILILALATIAPEKEGDKPAILLTTVVPLDVFLPEGMRFLVDGQEILHVPYQNCNMQGCWSRTLLDETAITAMKKGNDGLARFAVINGQGAEIQFSLKGFTAGMEALLGS